ncbi:carbohydrate-binding protein [Salinirubellus sp. GCM10025899]|uniref:carbohydrate-binding protein n=1 Tax=Salinirubellus sp. GCM10025899 TaxID=3252689 RepID=UPI00361E0433
MQGSDITSAFVQPVSAHSPDGTEIISRPEAVQVLVSESEPNDSKANATPISTNERASGDLAGGEVDWFAFEAPADEPLAVEFDRSADDGVSALAIYGPGGQFRDMRYVGTGTPVTLTETTETDGIHYLQVIDINGGTGSYALTVMDSDFTTATPTPEPAQTSTPEPTPTPTPEPTPEPCDGTRTFVPNSAGRIVAEAEHFVAQHGTAERQWYRTSEGSTPDVSPDPDGNHASGASNGEYIEILPDTRVDTDDPLRPGENFDNYPNDGGDQMAVVDYPVEFEDPGRYYVWVRALRMGSDDNGVHVGINDTWPDSGARIQWCTPPGEWHWRSHLRVPSNHCGGPDDRAYIEVDSAGTHTVQFAMREDGFEMDKFILTRVESYEPSGMADAESARGTCGTVTPTPEPMPEPEASGEIWIEAESAADGSNFEPFEVRSDGAASGGQYIATADEGRFERSPPDRGRAEYTFDVPKDGEYVLWGRVRTRSRGNTFHVSLDGDSREFHGELTEGWFWTQLPHSTASLSSGTHTLTVSYREDGAALDKLLVTPDTSIEPSGTGGSSGDNSTPEPTPEPTPTPRPSSEVWIEAESAAGSSNFAPLTVESDGDASNGEYISVPNGTGRHLDGPSSSGLAEYQFSVPESGEYAVWGRCIAPTDLDNSFWVSVDDGRDNEWWVDRDSDGGQTEWAWFQVNDRYSGTYPVTFDLDAGEHTLTVAWREDGTKLDKLLVTPDMSFEPSGTGGSSGGGSTPADGQSAYADHDPSRIEAENYDEGGEGVAYHDSDADNQGGAYRSGGIDVQSTSDAGGGHNVGWIEDGEWLEYTIDLASGTYDLVARLASPNSGTKLRASLDSQDLGTFEVPNTGDWQNWQTVRISSVSVSGSGVLRLESVGSGFNLNWVGFVEADDSTDTATPTPEPTPASTPDPDPSSVTASIAGELKEYHAVELTFDGPSSGERADPNPFLDYRLQVTFEGPSGQSYDVPGFYAGDGRGGPSGNKWRCRFSPDEAGAWSYAVSFRRGSRVAVSRNDDAGSPTGFDGMGGSFSVGSTDKSGRDFRARGMIKNRGGHYYTFDNGDHWLKAGPDLPENFLARDFDAHGGRKGAIDYIADRGPTASTSCRTTSAVTTRTLGPTSRSTTTRPGTTSGSSGTGTTCSGTPSVRASCCTSSSPRPSTATRPTTTVGTSVPSGNSTTEN